MARNTFDFKDGKKRDAGKVYRITEMSAAQGEAWAFRVLLAILGNDADIPDDLSQLSAAGLARMGFQGLSQLKWEVAEPILDDMLACVEAVPNPKEMAFTRPLIDEDTEEIGTRLALRKAWWDLHMDFFIDAAPLLLDRLKAVGIK